MKKGTLLFVAILSLVLVVGCGSSTDQTSIIPAAPAAAAVVAPAAAVSAAAVKVPAGGTVTITTATAGATAPAAALNADAKVELTPGATYTVAVDPDGIAGNGDDYTFTFVQPAVANGFWSGLRCTAANFAHIKPNPDGTAIENIFNPVFGGIVDTFTAAATSTNTLTSEQVTTAVGDMVAPAFTATFSHDTDVDADGKYTKGDKFKVTVSMSPAEAECKIDVTITADGGYKVVGTRTYNSAAGSVASAIITTTDIANPVPHDTANTYTQSFVQTPQGFTMVASDGTFPYDGTYTYELKVTDKAGNMAKATGTVVVFP